MISFILIYLKSLLLMNYSKFVFSFFMNSLKDISIHGDSPSTKNISIQFSRRMMIISYLLNIQLGEGRYYCYEGFLNLEGMRELKIKKLIKKSLKYLLGFEL